MEKKICSKCNIEKEVCEFYKNVSNLDGKRPECKICSNKQSALYNQKNKEKLKKIKQKYVDNNKEKVRKSKKDWFIKNPDYQNNWSYKKYISDDLYKLKEIVRARLGVYFNYKNIVKKSKTFDIVGCTPEFLKEYLENKFTDGMSWENHGVYGWHIDHIIPLSSAKTEEEMYKLCHYTNLQPLWANENLKKSNKILI
jgi:hypothetical protein